MFENSWLGLVTIDRESRVIYANKVAEKCLEMAPGSLVGKSIRELSFPFRAAFLWGYEKVLRDQVPVKYDRPVGADKRLSFSMGPDEYGVVVAVEDISHEWSQLEAQRIALLTINTLPDDVFTVRHSGHIVNVNDRACHDTGYSKEELRGMTIRRVLPGLEIGKRDSGEQDQDAWRDGVMEMELLRRDGSRVPVEVSITLKRIYGIMQYLVIVRDITKRKRAEEALRESEARLARAQLIAHIGNWSWDLVTNILEYSDECYRLLGYEPGEIKPVSYDFFVSHIHPDDKESFFSAVNESIHGFKPFSIDFRLIRHDGDIVYMHDDGEVQYDAAGKPIRMFGTVQDITERKRAEGEVIAAKQQAELYLDLMGHDINNMHQIALGYLELARDLQAVKGNNEYLDTPIEVLQRSAQLIQNVRKLQKLREGVFKTQDVDVCRLLADVQREFGAVPHKAIALNMNGCECCHVRANELLHDVFANLVSNAIKHTGDRADIVMDMGIVEEGDDRFCHVAVEDNGPGIPDDFKEKIFTRTLKGTANAKGMGLGLYLVKSLVDSYGGRVWVEDRVQGDYTKGARFVVMLPAVENQ